MLALSMMPTSFVMPASGVRASTMVTPQISMQYAEYLASKQGTASHAPLPTSSPLFTTGYEEYMANRMANEDATRDQAPMAAAPAAPEMSEYEKYLASRGAAPAQAVPMGTVVPVEFTPVAPAMSEYEKYLASRGAAPAEPVGTVVPTEVAPAAPAMSEYEKYLASRGAAPAEPVASVAPVEVAPAAPAMSEYEKYLASRGADATRDQAPATLNAVGFSPTQQQSNNPIVEFVINGVPKKYRVMQ